MTRFIYEARDAGGQHVAGALTAASATEASQSLRRDGKVVVSIHEEHAALQATLGKRRRIKRDDVIFFTTQLAVMVDTGVPLDEALDAIARQTENLTFQEMILQLSDDVKGGVEFSASLQKHPKIFGNLFVALMRASEASGTMGQMLQRVSEYMEQERETRKQIKGAMTYPVCMLTFCVLVVVGLLVFILPRFEKIYSGKGAMLPLPTRILLGLSHGLVDYWPFIIGGIVAATVAGYLYFRQPAGKEFLDKVRINIPLFGRMYRKAYLARSLRTMATMVTTGVGILEGLDITAQVSGNTEYAKVWNGLAEKVKEGGTLSENLFECPLVPPTIAQMVDAGERTGKLGMVMNRVAAFCEDDLKVAVRAMTSMIEPIMIIVMGILVGGIAMALLLPVFSLSKVVSH
jgi:type IV pilus assembly protein PilC